MESIKDKNKNNKIKTKIKLNSKITAMNKMKMKNKIDRLNYFKVLKTDILIFYLTLLINEITLNIITKDSILYLLILARHLYSKKKPIHII